MIFLLVVMLAATWLRNAGRLQRPTGLHEGEITDIRIVKSIEQGDIRVFYALEGGVVRESLYHGIVTPFQIFFTHPTLGFQLLSIWSAAITMALLFTLAKRLYGHTAGLFAMAAWGLGFVPVLMSRNIGRESLLAIPILITLLLLTQRKIGADLRQTNGSITRLQLFLLSTTLGFSLYLHPSAYGLILGCLLSLAVYIRRDRSRTRITWLYWLFSIFLLTIIALPNAISVIQNPTLAGFARWLPTEGVGQRVVIDVQQIATNIGGIFWRGDQNVTNNIPGQALVDPLSALLILMGLLGLLRRWREENTQILLLIGAVMALPALLTPKGPDFLMFAPVLPVIAIFWGMGVWVGWRWLAARGTPVYMGKVGIVVLLLALFTLTQHNLFRTWHNTEERNEAFHRDLQVFANYLDVNARETPTVYCGIPSSSSPQRLNETDILQLILQESDLPIRFVDCQQGLVLIGGGEFQQIILPEREALASSPLWLREWLAERGEYQAIGADLGYLLTERVIQFEVAEPLAKMLGGFTTTRPLRYPREQEQTIAPAIRYGGNLTFLGYEFQTSGPYSPGSSIPIDLFWRVDGSVPKDIRIYLHLIFNEADLANITSQVDTVSVVPDSLAARDIWVHRVQLPLPETTPLGDYLLLLGAYSKQTGDRMPVYDKGEGATVRGDYLILHDVFVEAPEN